MVWITCSIISIFIYYMLFVVPPLLFASEVDLAIPIFNNTQNKILIFGMLVCFIGLFFAQNMYQKIKNLKTHSSMQNISELIFQTCSTYLIQQGKFIIFLLSFITICIFYYFGFLQNMRIINVCIILIWTILGILGSYGVSWFGIRINTIANSRLAFSALEGKVLKIINIPLTAGMSIGISLVCIELIMMLSILLFMPRNIAGACFIGFAIGESLGAAVLRICGGIFTKIADIGSDLMKIVFSIKEDDPRNPGVIADCTGDNAGDSIGPTADGFETYGVTGVALISFIVLAIPNIVYQAEILTWLFTMRIIMVLTSFISFYLNKIFIKKYFLYKLNNGQEKIDFEASLTSLVWITSIISIFFTFVITKLQLGHFSDGIWIKLAIIISCGTMAAALIPEIVKIFTSSNSLHVNEVVNATKEGGASLNILSGLVAGNFSAFWLGISLVILMFIAYYTCNIGLGLSSLMIAYPSIFSFGLVAFGMLGMGPVTIAVDSYGPVTDNAQSIYELSLIESIPNIKQELKKNFGFEPNIANAKAYLEENDSCGNTFKATAKPVLIGTAVVGSTTMIFSLILLLKKSLGINPEIILNLLNPYTLIGFLIGGAVIYWFCGATIQAVVTGSYSAVQYIKNNINLDTNAKFGASLKNSKDVVKICTIYAQKGMFNIFLGIFSFSLSIAFLSSPITSIEACSLFISYLIAIAIFGLLQAIFMANSGGCWDNAKKIVETNLKEKGSPLHNAVIIGDTVGDPFKDTSSVSLNPIIKFTTLFGLLAMEIAISPKIGKTALYAGIVFFIIALIFVYRSFYKMRIPIKK